MIDRSPRRIISRAIEEDYQPGNRKSAAGASLLVSLLEERAGIKKRQELFHGLHFSLFAELYSTAIHVESGSYLVIRAAALFVPSMRSFSYTTP